MALQGAKKVKTRGYHQNIFHKKVLQYSIFGLLFGLLLSICGAVGAFAFLYGEIAILPVGMRLYLYLSGMAVPFFLAGFGAMMGRAQDDLEQIRAETREYLARSAARERKLLHSGLQRIDWNEIIERGRRDEAAIHRQQEFLQALVQHNPAGVVMTGADRRILSCNPSFEAVFGLTAAEITGQSLEQVLDPESEAGGGDSPLAGEQAAKRAIHFRRKDGAVLVVEATRLPWQALPGQIEGQDGALWLFSAVPCEPAVPEVGAAVEAPGETAWEGGPVEEGEAAGVGELTGPEDRDADPDPASQAPADDPAAGEAPAVLDAEGEEAPDGAAAAEPAPAGGALQSLPEENLPGGDLLSDESLSIPEDILDVQSALPRFGSDPEYYNQLLQEFIAGLPGRLAKMYVALEEGSPSTLALLAYDLKGVAANFGACQIVQVAAELHACCEEDNVECVRQRVVDVTEAAERLKACAAQV